MTALRFPLKDVARLLAHTDSCEAHDTLYGDYTGPGLLWVKDEGTYIMSNGLPRLPIGENVVYAEGYGPDAEWEDVQDACGGDDFAEFLGAEINEMIRASLHLASYRDGWLVIETDGDQFSMRLVPNRKKAAVA